VRPVRSSSLEAAQSLFAAKTNQSFVSLSSPLLHTFPISWLWSLTHHLRSIYFPKHADRDSKLRTVKNGQMYKCSWLFWTERPVLNSVVYSVITKIKYISFLATCFGFYKTIFRPMLTIQCVHILCLFVLGQTATSGPGPHLPRGFYITINDAPQSAGFLWTSDQLVAETST